MINARLFSHYGIDTEKNLNIKKVCPRPFDTLLIDKYGQAYACECTAWLPAAVGNIQVNTVEEILNSDKLRQVQNTVQDGTYRLCNNKQCTYIISNWFDSNKGITNLRLGIDDSCNLSCPSCRNQKIFVSKGPVLQRKMLWVDKIISWIQQQDHNIKVHIGSDGDPFASLVYRYFMKRMTQLNLSNVSFAFQTNGLLLKKLHPRTKYIFDNLYKLNISIDGATKSTYEKLRRGGSWEKILENFEFISKIKKFPVHLHMVVQKDNWQEIPALLELSKRYNFDMVYLNEIQDWATNVDYKQQKQTFESAEYKQLIAGLQNNPQVNYFNFVLNV